MSGTPYPDLRVGQGFDIHRFTDDPTRVLVLGGCVFDEQGRLVEEVDVANGRQLLVRAHHHPEADLARCRGVDEGLPSLHCRLAAPGAPAPGAGYSVHDTVTVMSM